MDKIKNYPRASQSDSTSKKGSSSNPYTKEEYYDILESGEPWDGGYVEELGYIAPDVYIDGSLGSDPWSSFSNPWDYPASSESSSSSSDESHSGGSPSRPGVSPGGNSSSGNGDRLEENRGNSDGKGQVVDVANVLKPSDFSGYRENDKSGCFRRCKEMLAKANCTVDDNGEIAMVLCDSNGRGTKATGLFTVGCSYIDNQLRQGHPVIVAVDYKNGTSMGASRADQAGDHFVIVVGGCLERGYRYFDPATSSRERGTNNGNIFHLANGLLRSTATCTGSSKDYVLTSIRKNK